MPSPSYSEFSTENVGHWLCCIDRIVRILFFMHLYFGRRQKCALREQAQYRRKSSLPRTVVSLSALHLSQKKWLLVLAQVRVPDAIAVAFNYRERRKLAVLYRSHRTMPVFKDLCYILRRQCARHPQTQYQRKSSVHRSGMSLS